jgi:hypothetical protein
MLDDTEKKMLAQCDDDMAAQRVNALEMLREYNLKKKPPRKFRDIVADIENSVPRKELEDTEKRLDEALEANQTLARKLMLANAQASVKRGVVKVRLYWRKVALCAVVPALALTAWELWPQPANAQREAAKAAFQKHAEATRYEKTESDSVPAVLRVDAEPYWITVRHTEDRTGYRDAKGLPVTVQCVRIFAEKAVPEAASYRKARPYAFWGLGWLTWPEVWADCKPDTMRGGKK